jgi:hypothetical protein
MDHSGCYIYVKVVLGKNDREVLISSPLYLQEGEYFSGKLLLLMVHLMGMGDFVARTKIQVMTK